MVNIYTPEPGTPFNVGYNKVRNSEAAAWTVVGDGPTNRAVNIYGVKWDGSSGSYLQLRDKEEDEWYAFTSDGGAGIDLFINPLPLYTDLEYYDSEGNNTIIIYGVYV